MTLEATARRWASFNLREDQSDGLRIGEFATWRAARVVGDQDRDTPGTRRPGRGRRRTAAGDDGLVGAGSPRRAVSPRLCFGDTPALDDLGSPSGSLDRIPRRGCNGA